MPVTATAFGKVLLCFPFLTCAWRTPRGASLFALGRAFVVGRLSSTSSPNTAGRGCVLNFAASQYPRNRCLRIPRSKCVLLLPAFISSMSTKRCNEHRLCAAHCQSRAKRMPVVVPVVTRELRIRERRSDRRADSRNQGESVSSAIRCGRGRGDASRYSAGISAANCPNRIEARRTFSGSFAPTRISFFRFR